MQYFLFVISVVSYFMPISLQSLHANLANFAETKTWYRVGTEKV